MAEGFDQASQLHGRNCHEFEPCRVEVGVHSTFVLLDPKISFDPSALNI